METMAPERAVLSVDDVERKEMETGDHEERKEERSERRSRKGVTVHFGPSEKDGSSVSE